MGVSIAWGLLFLADALEISQGCVETITLEDELGAGNLVHTANPALGPGDRALHECKLRLLLEP